MENTERIKKVLSSVFDLSENQIDDDTSVDTVESWDSLRHMALILALEEEFGVSIPDEEVGNLINFKLIEVIVNECTRK